MILKITKVNEKKSLDFDWDSIKDLHRNDPPANSFSSRRYAEQFGLTGSVSDKRLRKLVKEGKLTRAKYGKTQYYWKSNALLDASRKVIAGRQQEALNALTGYNCA